VHVFVLCYDGAFYERVPHEVRKQGPWQGNRRGAVEALKPEYRVALALDGYALVKCEPAVFNPEASPIARHGPKRLAEHLRDAVCSPGNIPIGYWS
jgi:hypothetical protein